VTASARCRMLGGLLFLLAAGVLVLSVMALLEVVYPPAGATLSNCWWYAMVLYWKEGGTVILYSSSYTTLPHFAHTFDFVTFTAFDPKVKQRRFLPPPLFRGRITQGTLADVLGHHGFVVASSREASGSRGLPRRP